MIAEPLETPTDRRVAGLEALLFDALERIESGTALVERIRAALNHAPRPGDPPERPGHRRLDRAVAG